MQTRKIFDVICDKVALQEMDEAIGAMIKSKTNADIEIIAGPFDATVNG